jgi:hypothetical protein
MTDYRDFALELVEDMGYDAKDMLLACLKYMSMDDVEDMLHCNEYPCPAEDEDDGQPSWEQEWEDFGEDGGYEVECI